MTYFCFLFVLPSTAGSSLLCPPPPLPHIPSLCACISPCHSCPHILGSPVLSSRISLWNLVHLFPSIPRRRRWDERKTQRQSRRGNTRDLKQRRDTGWKRNTRKKTMQKLGVWCSSTVGMRPDPSSVLQLIFTQLLPDFSLHDWRKQKWHTKRGRHVWVDSWWHILPTLPDKEAGSVQECEEQRQPMWSSGKIKTFDLSILWWAGVPSLLQYSEQK